MDSGMLSMLGTHGGGGGILGERGVSGSCHCEVGASEGVSSDDVRPLGIGVGGGGRREGREERALAGVGLGILLFLSVPTRYDKGRSLPRSPAGATKELLVGFPGRFARKKKKRRGIDKARLCMAEFKFKFEFLQTRFENLPRMVSRGFKHDQELMSKV
jgi:hypothetical protein